VRYRAILSLDQPYETYLHNSSISLRDVGKIKQELLGSLELSLNSYVSELVRAIIVFSTRHAKITLVSYCQ
jgi:hypothetical protein